MPELLLGPLLRHVGVADATVWVETDAACEVDVLGRRSRTFHVEGHFYAIVTVRGLAPGVHPYTVALDGVTVWPDARLPVPASLIRPLDGDSIDLVYGSCRVTAPQTMPFTLPPDSHPEGRGVDALNALAVRLAGAAPESWPQALVLLGDQVYADEIPSGMRLFIEHRRATGSDHGDEVMDFEEYTRLYGQAWQDPWVRWLLSVVPSSMIWDDHDIHDDWNISESWLSHMRGHPWWKNRIVGAIMSYWLYQHLGNLSPEGLDADALLAAVRAAEDGGPLLRAFAERVSELKSGVRWSYRRDYGRTRLVVIDCRAARMLESGHRSMLDEEEWRWLEEQMQGDFDHLLLAVSTPYVLSPGIHYLEMWNEAVCDGAWGRAFASLGERLRQRADLDHWPAFRSASHRLARLIARAGSGARGPAPASIVLLTGDIHHTYIDRIVFPAADGMRSRVYQAVSSPIRNPLGTRDRRVVRLGSSRIAAWLGRALLATVRLSPPDIRWRRIAGPWFENQVSMLEVRGRGAVVRIELVSGGAQAPLFEQVAEQRLV